MTEAERGGRAIYAATAVERMVGHGADTLRAWEQRYGLTPPVRSPGGQLLYTRDDVERLRWIAGELEAGRQPGTVGNEPATSPSAVAEHAPAPQLLVLLAERDGRAAELEEFFLRTEGYRVALALSADEAASAAAANPPDVALVELSVSGYSGLDLCRRLRDITKAPIIAISNLDRRDEALSIGVDAFLLKPIDPLLLISTVKDLLGESAFLRPHVPD